MGKGGRWLWMCDASGIENNEEEEELVEKTISGCVM